MQNISHLHPLSQSKSQSLFPPLFSSFSEPKPSKMDYKRMEKPFTQSSAAGFSPRKLRAMLLGVEKKQQQDPELEDPGKDSDEVVKDVSMVSSVQHHNVGSLTRARSIEDDGGSGFEFQKARSALLSGFAKAAPSKWDDAQKWIASSPGSNRGGRVRRSGRKVEVEERVDVSEIKREIGGMDCCGKMGVVVEGGSVSQTASVNLSRHDSSSTAQSVTTTITPPSTARSVSMRDMGTEMTPIASQEPSRTGTPISASTPIRSPTGSRSTTPRRNPPNSVPSESSSLSGDKDRKLTEKEQQIKTRREIMMLGTQLGKANIAAWASKEDEEKDASTSFQTLPTEQQEKSIIHSRAVAWEEAEKAKYLARFKEKDIKIQAWENHQKAKGEAEMRKMEVEVERMKAHAHDRLMSNLTAMRHKAEEKRGAAEAKKNHQASKTAEQADYIRRTGHIPSSFFCWSCCF